MDRIADNGERDQEVASEVLLQQLRVAKEEIEQLLYTASHDLKSPLITIQGFSGIAKEALERNDIEGAKDPLMRITKAAETMANMLSDLLKLSREKNVSALSATKK